MTQSRLRLLNFALLFTAIAIGIHVYLARQHYALRFGAGAASACNINEKLNCDAVAASAYSVFMGIPLAVWGATANAVLLVMLLIVRLGWTDHRETTGRHSLALAALVAAASVVMGAISVIFMSTYCLFCIIAYVLSFVVLLLAWKGVGGLGSSFGRDMISLFTTHRGSLAFFIAIPALAFFADAIQVKGYGGGARLDAVVAERVAEWRLAAEHAFDDERGLVLYNGTGEPRAVLVEFADFLCPHCKHAAASLEAFAQAHPDLKFVFKVFPLDGTCNPDPMLGGSGDGVRCRIAAMVMCERKLGSRGWDAHHYFFDRQEEMFGIRQPEAVMEKYCKDTGTDCAALKTCVESSEIRDEVRAMAQEGINAKIRGTPAIFLNGRQLGAGQMLPVLEEAYRSSK